jgi:hypothetical protein
MTANVRLEQISSELSKLTKQFTEPLFLLFDFFELQESIYADIVNRFVRGECT